MLPLIFYNLSSFSFAQNNIEKGKKISCSQNEIKTVSQKASKHYKNRKINKAISELESIANCIFTNKIDTDEFSTFSVRSFEQLSFYYFKSKKYEECIQLISNIVDESDKLESQYKKCLGKYIYGHGQLVKADKCSLEDKKLTHLIRVPSDFLKRLNLTSAKQACLGYEKHIDTNALNLILIYTDNKVDKIQKIRFKDTSTNLISEASLLGDEDVGCSLNPPELLLKNQTYILHLNSIGRPCLGGSSVDEYHSFYNFLNSNEIKVFESISINLN